MRHLWSLLAGVVVAPLTWLLLATGQHRAQVSVADWEQAGRFHTADLIGPVIFLVVAGLLLGVLGTLRFSPAGPVAAGLLLVLPTVFMVGNPFRTMEVFSYGQPRRLFGQDFEPWLPVMNGTLLVLGALLLVAVISIQRWRRWPVLPGPIPTATDDEVISGMSALTKPSTSPPAANQTPAGQPTLERPSGTGETPDRQPMSDDDILAEAAAIDEQLSQRGQQPRQSSASAPAPLAPAASESPPAKSSKPRQRPAKPAKPESSTDD